MDRPRHPDLPADLLLAVIDGEPLGPADQARLEAGLAADPELASWIKDAQRDRDRLRALARLEADRAPEGIALDALAEAERAVLLGGSTGGVPRSARRLRITPVRFVAAAALIILTSAASIVGLIITGPVRNLPPGGSTPPGPTLAHAPAEPSATPESPETALTQAPGALRGLAAPVDSDAGARAALSRVDTETAVAPARAEHAQRQTMADAAPPVVPAPINPTGALTYRLIRSVKAGPDRAVSPEKAAALALQGRLMIVARATTPAEVEAALLASPPVDADPGSLPGWAILWRPITDLAPAAGDAQPLDPDGPRLLLTDIVSSPAVLTRALASIRGVAGKDAGAWLQEIDRPIRLTPRAVESDLRWWRRPAETWAPRVTVPVLIEPAPEPAGAAEPN